METPGTETPAGVARMRIVGGNLALDFVNSRSGPPDGPPDDDVLRRYPDLVAWARYAGGLDRAGAERLLAAAGRDPDAARSAYRRARRVRDLLDRLFRTAAGGGRLAGADLARLRDEEVAGLARADLVPTGDGFGWRWDRAPELDSLLWPVVHAAVDLLTAGPLERVKGCAGCRFLFLDESRNRSRRWCSMEDCGTSEKIRRYLARRAATRTPRRVVGPGVSRPPG